MGGEDFGAMLKGRPGAYIKMGQAAPGNPDHGCGKGLHSPHYDFNDEILKFGISYWVRLVENALRNSQQDDH
jgi:hippurate hydrolase